MKSRKAMPSFAQVFIRPRKPSSVSRPRSERVPSLTEVMWWTALLPNAGEQRWTSKTPPHGSQRWA